MANEQPTVFDVRRYGATANTDALQTAFLQKAIDDCAAHAGGRVLVAGGVYLTGTLFLRSGVTFFIEAGAVIRGSASLADYRPEGALVGLIIARDAHDVSIQGPGMIDGQGGRFMDSSRTLLNGADGPVIPRERPGNLVFFCGCTNVLVRDVILHNAPYWTLHMGGCDGVTIDNLKIDNDPLVPNNDGIHCTTSRNVRISNCSIRTGDDAIAITGLTDHQDMVPGFVAHAGRTHNVVVSNCILSSRSAGIRVGYGDNDMSNFLFENIIIEESNRGIGIFVRGPGSISNVTFDNIHIQTHLFSTGWWGNSEPIHISCLLQQGKSRLGKISGIRFSRVVAESETGIVLLGCPASLLEDVTLDQVTLTVHGRDYRERPAAVIDVRPALSEEAGLLPHDVPGLYARHVDGLRLHSLRLRWQGTPSPWSSHGIEVEDFRDLEIDSFVGSPAHSRDPFAAISLARGRDVAVTNSRPSGAVGTFLCHAGVEEVRELRDNDTSAARVPIRSSSTARAGMAGPTGEGPAHPRPGVRCPGLRPLALLTRSPGA